MRTFGCYGKLPAERDFVSDRSADLDFDLWVQQGWASWAESRARAEPFPPLGFVWNPPAGPTAMLGRIVASRDRGGRRFPFVVYEKLEKREANRLTYRPRIGEIDAHLRDLMERCSGKASRPEVLDVLKAGPQDHPGAGFGDAESSLETVAASELWNALGSDGDAIRTKVLPALIETVVFLRDCDRAQIRFGIQYPLPSQSGQLAHQALAFWLRVTAALLKRPLVDCSWFWSAQPGELEHPFLVLFFSKPTDRQWAVLMDPNAPLKTMTYLTKGPGNPSGDHLTPEIERLLDDSSADLESYIRFAQSV